LHALGRAAEVVEATGAARGQLSSCRVRGGPIGLPPMKKITALALALGAALLTGPALAKDTAPPEEVRKEAREIFQKVIAFRTSEGLGQVPAMAQYLAERFRAAGFPE